MLASHVPQLAAMTYENLRVSDICNLHLLEIWKHGADPARFAGRANGRRSWSAGRAAGCRPLGKRPPASPRAPFPPARITYRRSYLPLRAPFSVPSSHPSTPVTASSCLASLVLHFIDLPC